MSMQHSAGHAGMAAYLVMWMAMMVPMMLPSLIPELVRYHRSMPGGAPRHGRWFLAAAGYFAVWAALGAMVWAVTTGMSVTNGVLQPDLPAERWIRGSMLLLAGGVQLTRWKARQLVRCRDVAQQHGSAGTLGAAWMDGMRLGARCALSCGSLMLALLVVGMGNIVAMVAVTVAITAERLAAAPRRVAAVTGVVLLVVGVCGTARGWVDARATSADVLRETCAVSAARVGPAR